MPDSLISNHTAYVASLRGCPSCPDRLSVLAGMRTKCVQVLRHLNAALAAWVRWKYRRFKRRERASMHWLGRIARRDPKLFAQWQFGVRPEAGS